MKSCVFAILFLAASLVHSQEPPLPAATETPAPSPSARPQLDIPDIPMTVEPSPLVPSTSPAPKKTLPSLPELDAAFQHSSLGQAVEEQRLHLEWRKLKNRASADPEVIAAKKAIGRADGSGKAQPDARLLQDFLRPHAGARRDSRHKGVSRTKEKRGAQ